MTDWSELKRLAEAEIALREIGKTADGEPEWIEAEELFDEAIGDVPKTFLALIAENEENEANSAQWQKAFVRIAGELFVLAAQHGDFTDESTLQQAIDFLKGAMAERDQLKAENEALQEERDEADRRAGAAERKLVAEVASRKNRDDWLREAKEAAGYSVNETFDLVWNETLGKALERDQLKAELERLQEEREKGWRLAGVLGENCTALVAELERVRADAEALRKHLVECSDSLESEILDRYGSSKDHPAMRRKFECDMRDVIDARAAIGKGGRSDD